MRQGTCGRREKELWKLLGDSSHPLFKTINFQLWDFSIDYLFFFSSCFVSLVFFDLGSSIKVSPRHSAVIITFLGGVYFILFGWLVF